jgi:hypothetical protein
MRQTHWREPTRQIHCSINTLMNHTLISRVQHSLVASKHKNPRSCTQTITHSCPHKLHMHTHSPLQASASLALFTLQVTCVCTYKIQVCNYMPISISLTHRHVQTWMPHTDGSYHTKPHMLPHTLPPLFPWPHTPSHPRSLTPRSGSGSKMPAGSALIGLLFRRRYLGTRRGGSQPSHTPPAHARCVHQHAHACAPCTCAMHMHVCTVALSLSLHMRAPCMLVRMCMCF